MLGRYFSSQRGYISCIPASPQRLKSNLPSTMQRRKAGSTSAPSEYIMSAPKTTPNRSASTAPAARSSVFQGQLRRGEAELNLARHHLQTFAGRDVELRVEIANLPAHADRKGIAVEPGQGKNAGSATRRATARMPRGSIPEDSPIPSR